MSNSSDQITPAGIVDAFDEIIARFGGIWCAVNGSISINSYEQSGILQVVEDAKSLTEGFRDRYDEQRNRGLSHG